MFHRWLARVQGCPASPDDLPLTPRFSASLLELRECLHYLRFSDIMILRTLPSQADRSLDKGLILDFGWRLVSIALAVRLRVIFLRTSCAFPIVILHPMTGPDGLILTPEAQGAKLIEDFTRCRRSDL